MSVNKHLPHVLILPEDDANRQLANGFYLHVLLDTRRLQILEEAGGWRQVLHLFQTDHVPEMNRYPNRSLILIVDLDEDDDRLHQVKNEIPENLRKRVFVLSVWSEPERLRQNLGTYETIGLALADDCRYNTNATWSHHLLNHNAEELTRLRAQVYPFLFLPD